MILDLRYSDITGPGRCYYSPGNPGFVGSLSTFRDLQDGISSESLADEVAAELAAELNAAYGTNFEPADENPPREPDPALPPPPADPTLARYLERAAIAPRVMARWAAGNDVRLAAYTPPLDPETGDPVPEPTPGSEGYADALAEWLELYDPDVHGWSPGLFATFLERAGPVVVLLNSLAFGATAAAVQAFEHPLATPAAKAAYLADMAAEGALPQDVG